MARIEVSPEEITELVEHRDKIQLKLTSLGFAYVSLDLRGYRTGSMNEELPEAVLDIKVSSGNCLTPSVGGPTST